MNKKGEIIMSLEKLENNPDFAKMQEEILEFWEKDKTFEK